MSPRRSRALAPPPDPRHAAIKACLAAYWAHECPTAPDMPWEARDAGALGSLLRASPTLTIPQVKVMLNHRYKSKDHAPGERVFVWIGHLMRYAEGPLNQFRQKGDSDAKPNRADDRVHHVTSATSAALDRVRRTAGH